MPDDDETLQSRELFPRPQGEEPIPGLEGQGPRGVHQGTALAEDGEDAGPRRWPDVEIIDFNERGPVLAVRPYTHTDYYWQVYFDTNRVITETFGAAGYPVPEAHFQYRVLQKTA